MENWRNFFESSGQDIWTVIDKAIVVAAADFPQEIRLRRDSLTERMYTAHLLHPQDHDDDVHPRGSDKTNATSGVYHRDEEQEEENDDEPQQDHRTDSDDAAREMVRDRADDTRDTDLLATLDEWDQEGMYLKEIMYIKESIQDVDQPESDVLEHLHKLEDLNISVELLQRTEIGKEVNGLRKHSSRRVRALAKKIVRSWKDLVDEWVGTCQQTLSATNGNGHSEMGEEEEGLPSPPLDEGALLVARTASLEMSQFFDFMDDDLSAGSGPSPPTSNNLSDEFGSLPDSMRKNDVKDRRNLASSPVQEHDSRALKGGAAIHKVDKHRPVAVDSRPDHNSRVGVASTNNFRKPSTLTNGAKPTNGNSVSNRPPSGQSQQKPNNDYTKKPDARPTSNFSTAKPKPEMSKPGVATKPKTPGEIDVSEKFLLAKRKLAEGYQQISEAKKQRTVQALDLTDLPKGGPKSARLPQPHMKPGQNRGWTNGRR